VAVEELSRADASAGVIVDVQNTLVNNAFLGWATEEQRKRYCRMTSDTVGAYALSEAGSGSDAFASDESGAEGRRLRSHGRKLWITNARKRAFYPVCDGRSFCGLQGHHGFHHRERVPVSPSARRRQARHPSVVHLRTDPGRLSRAEGELLVSWQGYKIAIETLNEGRIGIGAQMLGVARAPGICAKYAQERKQLQNSGRLSGDSVPDRTDATDIKQPVAVYNALA